MANLYQSVLDEANEKRSRLVERGWEPSKKLLRKVAEYRRDAIARETEYRLCGKSKSK